MATNAGPVLQRSDFDGDMENLYWKGGEGDEASQVGRMIEKRRRRGTGGIN
jgi:hypothetical protein